MSTNDYPLEYNDGVDDGEMEYDDATMVYEAPSSSVLWEAQEQQAGAAAANGIVGELTTAAPVTTPVSWEATTGSASADGGEGAELIAFVGDVVAVSWEATTGTATAGGVAGTMSGQALFADVLWEVAPGSASASGIPGRLDIFTQDGVWWEAMTATAVAGGVPAELTAEQRTNYYRIEDGRIIPIYVVRAEYDLAIDDYVLYSIYVA